MQITLVRHAQSIWNAEDRWQGQSDVPLSELGRTEARKVGARLGPQRFDRIVASDLSRAADTARAIAGERPITFHPGLREMNLGVWCGLPHAEVAQRFPDELLALQRGEPTRIGGTGETIVAFGERVMSTLAEIEREGGENLLVVSHGGVIRAVMMAMLGLSGRERPLIGSGNTGISRISVEPSARTLTVYNDQQHLGLFEEEGDRVVRGATARSELIQALALGDVPVAALDDTGCAVLHTTASGRAQLRRYGVGAPPG